MFICCLLSILLYSLSLSQHFSSVEILTSRNLISAVGAPAPTTHLDGEARWSQLLGVSLIEAVFSHQRSEVLQTFRMALRRGDV